MNKGEMTEPQAWVDGLRLDGHIIIPEKDQALKIAMGWEEKVNTCWTDGSRMDDGGVGCSVVWMEQAGTKPKPWVGRNTGRLYHPLPVTEDTWTGESYHLGKNKDVFDAEVYAIYRAVRRFNRRQEHNASYTVFTDAVEAIRRFRDDHLGPGQQFAIAVIKQCQEMRARGCSLTLRWVPSHKDVAGNELADWLAKIAAKCTLQSVCGDFLSQASLAYLKRRATEERSARTKEWIHGSAKLRKSYILPPSAGIRRELRNVNKGVASRYYQLLTGHALIGPYLKDKIKKKDSDHCWWCGLAKRQTREHLFKECSRWKHQIDVLWKTLRKDLGWKKFRQKPISRLFAQPKATGAILKFISDTDVGKLPTSGLG